MQFISATKKQIHFWKKNQWSKQVQFSHWSKETLNFLYSLLHLKFKTTTLTFFFLRQHEGRVYPQPNHLYYYVVAHLHLRERRKIYSAQEVNQSGAGLNPSVEYTTTKSTAGEQEKARATGVLLRRDDKGLMERRLQEHFWSSQAGPGQDLEAQLRRRLSLLLIPSLATRCHWSHFPALRADRQKGHGFCAPSA